MRDISLRLFVYCIILTMLAYDVFKLFNGVNPDPAFSLLKDLGRDSLSLLLLGLAVTPIVEFTKIKTLLFARKIFGIASFVFALLHVLLYFLTENFDLGFIFNEITSKPYLIKGFVAFIGLFILTITSNQFSIKKLGKYWSRLHKLVYVILIIVLIHWKIILRSDYLPIIPFAVIGCFLVLFRVFIELKRILQK